METPEQKKVRMAEWNRHEGIKEYIALTTDTADSDSMQRLAFAEEEQLNLARGVFPKNDPLADNYDRLVASNSRKTGPMDSDVEKRLRSVAEGLKKQYGSTEQWAASFLTMLENDSIIRLPENEIAARMMGFAFTALQENDIVTAYATLDRAGLLDNPKVREAIKTRRDTLKRSDSPSDEHALETMVRLFPENTEAKAA